MSVATLKRAIADNLYYIQGKNESLAAPHDYYMALAYTVRDRLIHRWLKTIETYFQQDAKLVFYLSAEFLMGRQLGHNLVNVGLWERAYQALTELGLKAAAGGGSGGCFEQAQSLSTDGTRSRTWFG